MGSCFRGRRSRVLRWINGPLVETQRSLKAQKSEGRGKQERSFARPEATAPDSLRKITQGRQDDDAYRIVIFAAMSDALR